MTTFEDLLLAALHALASAAHGLTAPAELPIAERVAAAAALAVELGGLTALRNLVAAAPAHDPEAIPYDEAA